MQLDREQAKRILSASFREDESPHPVADMEAALQLLETDPELAAWFEQELCFDSAVAEGLEDAPVPEGLHEACLESFAQGVAEAEASSASIATPRRPFLGLLLAASGVIVFAVLGGLRYFQNSDGSRYADFRSEMVDFISDRFALGFQDRAFANLNDWVAGEGGTPFERLPQSIAQARSVGCNLVTWDGGQASLFCFMGGEGKPVHLFVTPIAGLNDGTLPDASGLAQQVAVRGLKTIAWKEGDLLYMLCGSSSEVEVNAYLGGENVAQRVPRQHLIVSAR